MIFSHGLIAVLLFSSHCGAQLPIIQDDNCDILDKNDCLQACCVWCSVAPTEYETQCAHYSGPPNNMTVPAWCGNATFPTNQTIAKCRKDRLDATEQLMWGFLGVAICVVACLMVYCVQCRRDRYGSL